MSPSASATGTARGSVGEEVLHVGGVTWSHRTAPTFSASSSRPASRSWRSGLQELLAEVVIGGGEHPVRASRCSLASMVSTARG